MPKVTVDASTCVGCGLCEQLCPEIFELGSEGIAKIKTSDCSKHKISEVAEQCPVTAIMVK